jgi:hypothetical protein
MLLFPTKARFQVLNMRMCMCIHYSQSALEVHSPLVLVHLYT